MGESSIFAWDFPWNKPSSDKGGKPRVPPFQETPETGAKSQDQGEKFQLHGVFQATGLQLGSQRRGMRKGW